MYKTGDKVVYSAEGLCEICDITERTFGKDKIEYYVLKPLNKNSEVVYVPKNNKRIMERMRKILNREEADELLDNLPACEEIQWNGNSRERQKEYKEILLCGSSRDVLRMTRTLYMHQIEQLEKGKKLHAVDERFLKEAEKLIFEELAYVFGITVEEVLPMIIRRKEIK